MDARVRLTKRARGKVAAKVKARAKVEVKVATCR